MQINTCRFVYLSDLLDGCGALSEQFFEMDHNFTWGDSNLTLIDIETIVNVFDEMSGVSDELGTLGTPEEKEYYTLFLPRINKIREMMDGNNRIYINLEAKA